MGKTIYVGQEDGDNDIGNLTAAILHSENDDIVQLVPTQQLVLDEIIMLDKRISWLGNSGSNKPTVVLEKNSAIIVMSSFVTISGINFIDRRSNGRTTPMLVVNSSCRSFVFSDNSVQYQKTCMRLNGDGFYLARNSFLHTSLVNSTTNSSVVLMITGTNGVCTIRENSFSSSDNNLRPLYLTSEGTSTCFNGILSICDNTVGTSSQSFLLMDDFTTDTPGNFFLDIRDNDCQTAKFVTLYPTNERALGAFGDILLSGNHMGTCLNGLVFIDNDVIELSKLQDAPSICIFANRIDKKVVALDRIPIYGEVLTSRYGQLVPPSFRQCVCELDQEPYTDIDVSKNVGEVLTLKHGSKVSVVDNGLTIPVINLSRNESVTEAPCSMISIRQRNCHVLLNASLFVPKTSLENYSFPLSMYIRKISVGHGEIQQILYENRFIPKTIDTLHGFFYVGETIQSDGLYAKRIGDTETFEIMGTNDFEPGRYLFGYQGIYNPGGMKLKLSEDSSSFILVAVVLIIVLILALRMNRK
jgi:hypothetical protein